jgi:RNA polymerase sigma-70 factor (ECF subfamily)
MVWPRHPASVPEVILTNLDGLYRFACRLTRDADRAQDLVQETALRALQRERTIVRDPRAWLFQTLYHTFISDYRRLSREAINVRFSEEELDLQNLSGPLSDAVAMEDVRKAVEALPDELRSVVWLSDALPLSVRTTECLRPTSRRSAQSRASGLGSQGGGVDNPQRQVW